jgi:hypothetical protein
MGAYPVLVTGVKRAEFYHLQDETSTKRNRLPKQKTAAVCHLQTAAVFTDYLKTDY